MDNNLTHITSDSDEISLKEIVLKIRNWGQFILSKWKLILIAGILGGVIGFLYSWASKPIYVAQLSFALQDEKGSSLGGAMGLASQLGFDFGGGSAGGEFAGDNLLELMKSRSMVEKTLLTPVNYKGHTETLAELYIDFNNLREAWADKPELKGVKYPVGFDQSRFSLKQDSMLSVFYKDLSKSNFTVDKIDKKLSIISVKVTSKNEAFSKNFAEVLVTVVSNFYIQTKTEKSAKNVTILQRQTDSVRRILYGNITGVAAAIDVNPNPNPFLSTLRVASQHKQVEAQANTAILTQLVTNLEVAKMSLLQETPLIQIIDKPILPLDKIKVGKIYGTLVGGIIFGFISVIIIVGRRFFKDLMR